MIWVAFALLSLLVAGALAWPLLRRSGGSVRHDALVVYRDQLDELGRDLERGLIDEAAAAAARREIERRILAEDGARPAPAHGSGRRAGLAAVVAVVVVAAAAALYASLGSPGLPSVPFAQREDLTGPEVASEEEAQIEQMIGRLEERLAEDPSNTENWLLLANTFAFVGRYGEAAQAMTEVLALSPGSGEWHAAYGEFLTLDHEGSVTPAARRAFQQALDLEPGEPVARYYLGIADAQAGDVEGALAGWQALLAETPANAAWREPLIARIAEAEEALGLEPSAPPAAVETPEVAEPAEGTGMPGPTEADIAAASEMSEDEQLEMIRGMVAGLAERLQDEPDNLEGWSRLAQSYSVLGQWADSEAAYDHALGLAPDDPALLEGYANAVANGLSQSEPIPAEAVTKLDAVLARNPDVTIALYVTGLVASQAGDRALAKERWTRLRDLFPAGSAERSQVEELLGTLQ